MPIDIKNELTTNAMGGTEIMASALEKKLPPDLLESFQIIPSRVRSLNPDRKRVLWLHDLPGDPENAHLANGGFAKFDALVFVSNWQMQKYIDAYGIPWSKCRVIQNATEMFEPVTKSEDGPVRLVYHTTPHRGLDVLATAFDEVSRSLDVHLDVYSSFSIYGWQERDAPYKRIFDFLSNHPKATYHGAVPNLEVREALKRAHIFAYPSTWLETSCISMIEAMAAGCMVVHPNLGALYETASNWTSMYQFEESKDKHLKVFTRKLVEAISIVKNPYTQSYLAAQAVYTNRFYNWEMRTAEWVQFLSELRG